MKKNAVSAKNRASLRVRDAWFFRGRTPAVALTVAGICLTLPFAHSTIGAEPPTKPILVVETGMHTGLIRRLVVDAPRHRLITCSDDKTIRIWQMPDLRLISTLRVPIDDGHEGQLFAIAISPDGKTLAAGGWTGWNWDSEGESSIYLFDVASGELSHRVHGFKHAISTLNWTKDGENVIVGLQGRGGLHLLRLSDQKIIASDTKYLDKIMDVDVRSDGIVAVAALDGRVRFYDRNLKIAGRHLIDGGRTPSTIRFSPDGSLLAVGFIDTPGFIGDLSLVVANVSDLSVAYRPDLSSVRDQASFTSVAWSSDGHYLYAGGEYHGAGANPLYRWGNGGKAVAEKFPLVDDRITEIQQMPDGAIAFAAEDPGIGIIEPDTKRIAFRGRDAIDFSDAKSEFVVSRDGAVIQYPLRRGEQKQTFSPGRGGDQVLSEATTEAVFPPDLKAEEISIDDGNPFAPTINGKQPRLDDYEKVRSYAIAPDHNSVLLGTEWALRRLDLNANEIWRVPLPAVVRAINVARNGKLVIAALSDGTFRWYDMNNKGKELLAYFPHKNGTDWICWVPDGYYMSSVNGDNLVGWHLNRGRDLTPDFYLAVQFERILYRPDVVEAAFQTAVATITLDSKPTARDADFKIEKLRENAPPRLKLQTEVTVGAGGRQRLILQVHGEKNGRDIQNVVVFVNNIPVTPSNERRLSDSEAEHFSRKWEIELFDRSNNIRVESFNGVSMGVAQTYVELPETTRMSAERGNLYVFAVGANVFPKLKQAMQLHYAARDAEELAATLEARGRKFFKEVFPPVVLSDNMKLKPERAAIVSALTFLQQARAEDTIVVFLASHGISDAAGNYYFVPSDAEPRDVEAVIESGKAESLVPWTIFFEALRGIPGRRLLIVDTCNASTIGRRFDAHSLMKRSAASQFLLMLADEKKSQEYNAGKHGLFTYALINALAPKSDANGDGLVSVKELFDAAKPVVANLSDPSIGRQTPVLIPPPPLGEVPLMRSR